MLPTFALTPPDISLLFIELGAAIVGLAILARLANRFGFSAIPLYLLAGLAFGNGGLVPLPLSENFIHVGAEIGVVLLLFLLGLEYTGDELRENLQKGLPSGAVDFLLNFTPGFALGFLLGFGGLGAMVLGGVTYISSSGVIAKVLGELGRMSNPETPLVLSILVLEDLAMAVYLPLLSVSLSGQGVVAGFVSVGVALGTVGVVLFVAVRHGKTLSRLVSHQSDEIILLSVFGLVLLVAGIAQRLQVSAAVGAFLVGIAISGTLAERAHRLFSPLRDLFAATFFFFFGLEIAPQSLPPVLFIAAGLGVVTAGTKLLTGIYAAKRAGLPPSAGMKAGAALTARGEFSVVIAGLGVSAGLPPKLGALAAAYILLMAIAGPVLARLAGSKETPTPTP